VSEVSAFRALARRLGNPLTTVDGTSPAADGSVRHDRDRATADDRPSPRATLERKLRAAAERERDES
jgi:hypothetical protein